MRNGLLSTEGSEVTILPTQSVHNSVPEGKTLLLALDPTTPLDKWRRITASNIGHSYSMVHDGRVLFEVKCEPEPQLKSLGYWSSSEKLRTLCWFTY